ncbi:MAG: bifunctional 4-hydroxy-2-oxoglutarate aldolase/2-dehydro-3-deoxy-phosphogluconate aldolase [Clostridia bacterium]|nr:bifunctional 4-hydroxy-2-oxoglutarate aldolase/2-dehydro-3-deoxy-phosphogluconate aldolase [Clostridia bacterium]
MNRTIETIRENKIIAIIRGVSSDKIIPSCKALYAGGVKCIEITFNQSSQRGNEETYNAIKSIKETMADEICLGAGTVMTIEQVELAYKAGATYIISPNYDKVVVGKTLELGLVSIPGVLTPSEVVDANMQGASFAKLFPAGVFGLEYIKAIKAPISHIPMLAVGGIDVDNIKQFMDCGLAGVGVGSSLVNKKLINEDKFEELTQLAKAFVDQL